MVVDLEEGKLTFGLLDYWYIVREVGLVLCGPPPWAMIPEISQSERFETVREQADECDCCQPDHWYRGERLRGLGVTRSCEGRRKQAGVRVYPRFRARITPSSNIMREVRT